MTIDVRTVRRLAADGRAIKAPGYHPGKRGIPWATVVAALERCYHVRPDLRQDPQGARRHPHGWYALANLPMQRRLRIDFDVHENDHGILMLIVTAYHV